MSLSKIALKSRIGQNKLAEYLRLEDTRTRANSFPEVIASAL